MENLETLKASLIERAEIVLGALSKTVATIEHRQLLLQEKLGSPGDDSLFRKRKNKEVKDEIQELKNIVIAQCEGFTTKEEVRRLELRLKLKIASLKSQIYFMEVTSKSDLKVLDEEMV